MSCQQDLDCDVLVIGSGAAGLSAAITARLAGLDVLVTEKATRFGGTTARSGGWVWIPMSPQARVAGIEDSLDAVMTYLRHEAGDSFRLELAKAYLEAAPLMLEMLARRTCVRFDLGAAFPDYHPDAPGASQGGRSLLPEPIDARQLGEHLWDLAAPLRELSLAGLVIGSGTELHHFFNATRSWKSARFVVGRLLRHVLDMLRHGRGMTLVNGNALAARLGKSAFDLGIPLWLDAPAIELVIDQHRVCGALVERAGGAVRVRARRGVVLACDGFPHDVPRRMTLYPHDAGPGEHLPLAPESNTGDGLRMAQALGACVATGFSDAAAWTPVSKVPWPDGRQGFYPHFVDRAKPGIIAVDCAGRRFVNESDSYHDFIKGYHRQRGANPRSGIFFICDHGALKRYGMGIVKPFPFPIGHWLRSGYLHKAPTLAALAGEVGIDPVGLERTVAEFNVAARQGRDPRYGRGSSAYNRFQGDPSSKGNASLAPLQRAPYYAIRIWPGDIGTFTGLLTDTSARVLDGDANPVPGLYAAGNDMASVMGGSYPGAGITLGPAMVFGYIAARHIASQATLA